MTSLMFAHIVGKGLPTLRCWHKNFRLLLALLLGTALLGQTAAQNKTPAKVTAGETAEAHLGKGYEALKREQYGDAAEEFRAALAIDPTLVMRARFPLAIALFEQHKNAEARRELEMVRQSEGEQLSVSYYFGRLDLEEHDYKSAIANLAKAAANPPFPDTAFYLGLAYFKEGDDPSAEKWLKEATKRNPQDSRVEYQLALLYRKEGREEEANLAFSRTKEQKAHSDKLSQLKWDCAQDLDRGVIENAITVCEQLYNPDDAEMLTALGILYGQHGQLERALKPLVRAAELSPQSPQMQYNLAFTYYQLGRFADARGPLAGAVEHWPDLFSLSALYGAVLWQLGEAQPAYQALKHAHQLNSGDANTTDMLYVATVELARISEGNGADPEALRYLKEAAILKPADPLPHQQMVLIYTRTGRSEQAKAEQQKVDRLTKSSLH